MKLVSSERISGKYLYFGIFFFVGIAFVLGMFVENLQNQQTSSQCQKKHLYINPDLDCINTDIPYEQIRKSQEKTLAFTNQEIEAGHATRISVFFRDLQTQRWYGINENDPYSPGSLLKLPLAIAYYKLAEIDPSLLSQKVVFPKSDSLNDLEHFTSTSTTMVAGQSYSIYEMISRMLRYSDNDAVPLLSGYLNRQFYDKVFLDVGVDVPAAHAGGIRSDFYSAKLYGSILRILYNASYLSPDQSEEVLGMLDKAAFKQGLAAGLPSEIHLADKFGEGTAIDPTTKQVVKRELHDCGIVYRETNPYILCVMTEGNDFDTLSSIIAGISKIAWDNSDNSAGN